MKLSSILCDNSDDIENIQVLILMMIVMILFETWKTSGYIHIIPNYLKNVAGVRDGAAGPRDQPSSFLRVGRPSKDRPRPV